MALEYPEHTDQHIGDLAAALAATCALVFSLSPEEWGLPTPCVEWDVTELVRHLVRGNLSVGRQLAGGDEAFLRGAVGRSVDGAPRSSAAGADDAPPRPSLAETLERTGTDLLHAYTAPGALDRIVILPAGNVPGVVAARIRTVDVIVHGWDIGAATGRSYDVDHEVAERALAFTVRSIGSLSNDHRPFAPPVAVASGAPLADRLAGLLGREVPWVPPGDRQNDGTGDTED
ncbi:MAG TPA: TIGR03086 family metal-binding protein [Acidimicrobiales bacterium]|nr:TIGR03086 family metal-binding protein [Acidimicrobiales bacterium]